MTDTSTLISELRQKDIRLWLDQDQLKLSAPKGALDGELRAILQSRKQDILVFLRRTAAVKASRNTIVPIKPDGNNRPLFVVSGFGGDVYYFMTIARHIDAEQPLLSVQPPGLNEGKPLRSVEDIAGFQVEQIRRYEPQGPYLIAGHCSGGAIAFEVAQQLKAAGQQVALLALIGSPFPTWFRFLPQLWVRLGSHAQGLFFGSLTDRRLYINSKIERRAAAAAKKGQDVSREQVEAATMAAVRTYKPRYYADQLDLFSTADDWSERDKWRGVAKTVREHDFRRFGREELLLGAYAPVLAASLAERLRSI